MTGAFLNEVPKEGEGLQIKGSCMIAVASSKEEVVAELKNDTYFKNNVWDESKVCPLSDINVSLCICLGC